MARVYNVDGKICWTQKEAAEVLGITPKSLYQRINMSRTGEIYVNGIRLFESYLNISPDKPADLKQYKGRLLNYPFGEDPISRGLPGVWR